MDVIVFDLDNTLLDRDTAIDRYLRAWGAEGHQHAALVRMDERGYSERLAFCNELTRRLKLSLSAQQVWEHMQANLGTHCTPDAERLAMISRLRSRAKVGLLTNGGASNQRLKIVHAGLSDAFDFIVVTGEIGVSKPARQAFVACENWSDARYVMIGDHPEHDIAGAAACGWKTVWVANGRTWDGLAAPDAQIQSVDVVESALEGLFE